MSLKVKLLWYYKLCPKGQQVSRKTKFLKYLNKKIFKKDVDKKVFRW